MNFFCSVETTLTISSTNFLTLLLLRLVLVVLPKQSNWSFYPSSLRFMLLLIFRGGARSTVADVSQCSFFQPFISSPSHTSKSTGNPT